LLAIFAWMAAVYHLRGRVGPDPGEVVSFGRVFFWLLVAITVVPVAAVVVAVATVSLATVAVAVVAAGGIGVVGVTGAHLVAGRGSSRGRRSTMAEAVLPATTDLRPLPVRRLGLLLPRPLVIQGQRGSKEV